MLWEIDVYPNEGEASLASRRVVAEMADLGIKGQPRALAISGYLVQGNLDETVAKRLARELLVDSVVERAIVAPLGDPRLNQPPEGLDRVVHVLRKPGVMDPAAQSAKEAMRDLGVAVEAVRLTRKYWLGGIADADLRKLCAKSLANDSIEQTIVGPLAFDRLEIGAPYVFRPISIEIRSLDEAGLARLSREAQLYLKPPEMLAIQARFRELGRDPTDIELETIAQTWSEHCSHKTLAGRVRYSDERGERLFENMLKETIFAATRELRRRWGANDWLVSVFEDNAGVVRFDEQVNVVFKVETHNHPSALEPYGGANTGLGGVIRDPLGTGLGARPVCNTNVFCFASPELANDALPPGVLHPKRVTRGVVSGVRDYGNRMGIPTVNGAIYFDDRYLGNPLVYCGTVGVLPRDKSHKAPRAGDHIVAVGGRTGRDGIHGATFSSAELTSESESLSGGAVQIGNAITEKMLLDVILAARDRGLYSAITDCGAGGFSSAVGEMGEKIGAVVWLERIPLKYEGLSYTEMWISEAQERMVLSVPEATWSEFSALCASEGVEATIIGRFEPTGRLSLRYQEHQVGDLPMSFLHGGRPPVVRQAVYTPAPRRPLALPAKIDHASVLKKILGSPNVASKEWVIRQYDHEVQGGSVIKPLVGASNDGPSDAAVLRPVLTSRRGLVVACGMNPRYGDFDTYHMAASAIDEAVRNCVAVGADPRRIAVLDNFCWGDTDKPETLGSLTRAALACHDLALALETPFISGKDSLNNEFRYLDEQGQARVIAIPPSLLISALGQVDDVASCVTMDLKEPGNLLYQVGATRREWGGSHFALALGLEGGTVPVVDPVRAKRIFLATHAAIQAGLVRACHDLSEGGLAVALAEMSFAGELGVRVELAEMLALIEPAAGPSGEGADEAGGDARTHDQRTAEAIATLLYSESNSRFLIETRPDCAERLEATFTGLPCRKIGVVTGGENVEFALPSSTGQKPQIVSVPWRELKECWQTPLSGRMKAQA